MNVRRILTMISLAALACRGEATPPQTVAKAGDPLLQHHEIRPDQLPAPFETQSVGNPPSVSSRPADAALHLPPGFRAAVWASDVSNPRNMVYAPNGDVFLAETGAGRITVFRGGSPTNRYVFASGLDGPFGIAFQGKYVYVGNEGELVRFPYTAGQAAGKAEHLADLPASGHSTRNVIFNSSGSKLYVSIGSRSNVTPEEPMRAAIVEYNPDGSGRRIFASGLRNPVGLAWEPSTGTLWTAVNERDALGDDIPPDYITEVRDGAFYGWPYAYIGKHEEPRLAGKRPDLVAKTVTPSLLIEAHAAALGLAFYTGKMFPQSYRGGAFVALHGSWNRSKRSGYKVIFVPFRGGKPAGGYDDFMAGWAPDPASRRVWGRPVGLLVMKDGSLLVADDGGDVIWRVTYGP